MYDILRELANLGITTSYDWDDIYGTTQPYQVADQLYTRYGASGDPWENEMFSPLSAGLLKSATYGKYAPQIRQEGKSMLNELAQRTGGMEARKAAGGFAGSGGYQQFQKGAKDVYGKGMQGVLSDVAQQRGAATSGIQDIISQWKQTAQDLTYG